jgi:peptidoglycan/xylan/chitin deacetylase (PgdA/CDA1 family)
VLYHNPEPETFEKHLEYLSGRYKLIALSEFSEAIKSKNMKNIPKNALVITLDDGWKENYRLLPFIQKYKFRPTVFLTSHLINTNRHFWWTKCDEEEVEPLKKMPNNKRLEQLNAKYHYNSDREYAGERQTLNIAELEKMKSHVDFGLHTCFHPILTKCSSEEKRKEILVCKLEVEKILGRPVEAFAYPNGDYDEECIDILKECGLRIGRTTDAGWNGKSSNPYKLKVTGASDYGTVNKLAAELTGIPMFFQYLFKGSFNGLKDRL